MTVVCDVVLEQTLGHVTHSQNLQHLLSDRPDFEPRFLEVPFELSGAARFVPGYANWTLRAGWRTRRLLRDRERGHGFPDVRFIHSQVPSMLLGKRLSEVPTVVSLDATPHQYDELGSHYGHSAHPVVVERAKTRLARSVFARASHLVTWAAWTKAGLVDDYEVSAEKITVIPPGVDTARWSHASTDGRPDDGVTRLLFVGGDLRRKGGDDLLAAFKTLRERHGDRVELHVVTGTPVVQSPGITSHHGLTPNSDALVALYHQSDVFCLPTLGDCLPMVLAEAAAAHLAIVSTKVGAIPEIVADEQTGLLVDPGDVHALTHSVNRLIEDTGLRRQLADAGHRHACEFHDAATNADRLADLLISVARADADPVTAS